MSTKLPRFETEEQVREFWASHDSTEYFDELEELPEGVTVLLPRPPHFAPRRSYPGTAEETGGSQER